MKRLMVVLSLLLLLLVTGCSETVSEKALHQLDELSAQELDSIMEEKNLAGEATNLGRYRSLLRSIVWTDCKDSDGGIVPKEFGSIDVTYTIGSKKGKISFSDYCEDGRVVEYFCRGEKFSKFSYSCENGCSGGACFEPIEKKLNSLKSCSFHNPGVPCRQPKSTSKNTALNAINKKNLVQDRQNLLTLQKKKRKKANPGEYTIGIGQRITIPHKNSYANLELLDVRRSVSKDVSPGISVRITDAFGRVVLKNAHLRIFGNLGTGIPFIPGYAFNFILIDVDTDLNKATFRVTSSCQEIYRECLEEVDPYICSLACNNDEIQKIQDRYYIEYENILVDVPREDFSIVGQLAAQNAYNCISNISQNLHGEMFSGPVKITYTLASSSGCGRGGWDIGVICHISDDFSNGNIHESDLLTNLQKSIASGLCMSHEIGTPLFMQDHELGHVVSSWFTPVIDSIAGEGIARVSERFGYKFDSSFEHVRNKRICNEDGWQIQYPTGAVSQTYEYGQLTVSDRSTFACLFEDVEAHYRQEYDIDDPLRVIFQYATSLTQDVSNIDPFANGGNLAGGCIQLFEGIIFPAFLENGIEQDSEFLAKMAQKYKFVQDIDSYWCSHAY